MNLESWIFDSYPDKGGMRLWLLDDQGEHRSVLDPWQPAFHVSDSESVLSFLRSRPYPVSCERVSRRELFSGKELPVLELRCPSERRGTLAEGLESCGAQVYGADIPLGQAYHYDRGHFPLARCSFELDGDVVRSFGLMDDPWSLDYPLPPMRSMHMALAGSETAGQTDPNHAPRGRLVLSTDGRSHELEGSLEEQLESLEARLREWDPDIITTDWGDSYLLPLLAKLSDRLSLSRDPGRGIGGRGGRSFYTYGRTVYQMGIRYLFGRWHLDRRNSFLLKECGTDGLFEIARIAAIPVQRAARCTIGTSLSSMQMLRALKEGILIPAQKQQAEDFRPADELLYADQGGLVFEPEAGWYGEVAEYDFVSMYPALMVRWNISPETVNCPCCSGNRVPETAHHLCTRRQGLVPAVLAPILSKRASYKASAKTNASHKRRAAALKWTLVTCFGYLGYKNARFGKIEAHECVTAWGRETLLRAKEAVERRGFHILHALVDSLWVLGKPGTDYGALRRDIEEETGCPVGLEGVYRWLRLCPSKTDPGSGVPGRYFGAFKDGELKVRGLALRRRDTPRLLASMQEELLRLLAAAPGLDACRLMAGRLREVVEGYRERIEDGRVTAEDLAVTFHLSKDPSLYKHDTLHALAAKGLAAAGLRLNPGETVRYVIASARDEVKDWRTVPLALLEGPLEYDAQKYLELLDRAAQEVLQGLHDVQ